MRSGQFGGPNCPGGGNATAVQGVGGASIVGSMVTLTNNRMTGNESGAPGLPGEPGGLSLWLHDNSDRADLYNNIVWDNTGGDLSLNNDGNAEGLPSPVNLFHNNFDQSFTGVFITLPFPIDVSNLNNLDPLFVDASSGAKVANLRGHRFCRPLRAACPSLPTLFGRSD